MLADPLIRVQMLQCIAGRSTIYSMLQIVVLEGKKVHVPTLKVNQLPCYAQNLNRLKYFQL